MCSICGKQFEPFDRSDHRIYRGYVICTACDRFLIWLQDMEQRQREERP